MEIVELPVGRIVPSPHQPRGEADGGIVEGIAQSLDYVGILQPISVVPKGDRYQIVAGEQRWRAAVKRGLKTIPAIVREADDKDRFLESVIENEVRGELTAEEKGRAFRKVRELYGFSQEQLGRILGKSRHYVGMHELIASRLDASALALLEAEGRADYTIAAEIAGIEEAELQRRVAKRIVDDRLPRREALQVVQVVKKSAGPLREAVLEGRIGPEDVPRVVRHKDEAAQKAVIEEIEEMRREAEEAIEESTKVVPEEPTRVAVKDDVQAAVDACRSLYYAATNIAAETLRVLPAPSKKVCRRFLEDAHDHIESLIREVSR